MMKMFCKILVVLCFMFTYAKAQEPVYLHAKGYACEEIKAEESKSSARTKVADKAGFNAAEQLDLVKKYKNSFNEHDFNVMVYELVDSVLEGVSTQTVSEDENQICVEVNAMAEEKNLRKEIAKHLKERGTKNTTDTVIEAVNDVIVEKQKNENNGFSEPKTEIENRVLVFVAPTTFYNGAISNDHSQLFRDYLDNNENFYLTDSRDVADLIINPRIEKAKMDESKDGLQLMQIQTIFTIYSSDGKEIFKDEQNRAVICDKSKTEQQNAQVLLKKMFAKSAKKIAVEIEKYERKKNRGYNF